MPTTQSSGNWSDGTTWVGGVAPLSGETAIIAAGHEVTVTSNAEIGNSPADQTTLVLDIQGRLLVNPGVTFTIKGNWRQTAASGSNGLFSVAGHLRIDGTASGIKYKGTVGNEWFSTAKLVFAGTPENRASCASLGTGTTNGWISRGTQGGNGRVEADHCDFTAIGDATTTAIDATTVDNAAHLIAFRNCNFTRCGRVVAALTGTQSRIECRDSIWTDSLNAASMRVDSVVGTATRVIDNCRFDKRFDAAATGLSITNCLFAGNYTFFANSLPTVHEYNASDGNATGGPPNPTNCYFYDSSNNINPHSYPIVTTSNVNATGLVFDCPAGTGGDHIIGGTAGFTQTIRNCLIVPSASGQSSGKLVSMVAGVGNFVIEHNTTTVADLPAANAEDGIVNIGETEPGMSGTISSLRSNLAWSTFGKGVILTRVNQPFVADPLTSPNVATHNAYNDPLNATGSGVIAVYGPNGGYADVGPLYVAVRTRGTTGSFTLNVYHSNGITTAQTTPIAWNATNATAAAAIQSSLNTLADGTYVVASLNGAATNSSTGSSFTITRNGSALSTSRIWTILRPGSTNTTGLPIYTTREMFTSTVGLGENDVVADPNFLDASRNLATFDSAYLGNVAPSWTNATSYAVGDLVTSSDATFYNGRPINFRCKLAHVSNSANTTNGRPGASATTNWRTNWELASNWRIRNSRATYNPNVRQATPRDLWHWVRGGFAPRNQALAGAAHDGGTIGAIPAFSIVPVVVPPVSAGVFGGLM
jgi:hypothetical protein